MSDFSELDILSGGDAPQPFTPFDPRTRQPMTGADATPAVFYVLSQDSETAQNYLDDQAAKQVRKQKPLTAQEIRQRGTRFLAFLVTRKPWENVIWKGQPLACNLVNAEMLLNHVQSVRKQIQEFSAEEVNFLGNSSDSLPTSDDTSSDSASDQKAVA